MPDHLLPLPAGLDPATQAVVGTLVAGLDDQRRQLVEEIRDLPVAAFEWQAAPGMNSVGMLVAHLALVDVWWLHLVPQGHTSFAGVEGEFRRILGIIGRDDGMDVGGQTAFPDALRGWTATRYLALLERARMCVADDLARWTDADLAQVITDKQRALSKRWILYHVLEHFAAHFGQILLVKHQLRDAGLLPRA